MGMLRFYRPANAAFGRRVGDDASATNKHPRKTIVFLPGAEIHVSNELSDSFLSASGMFDLDIAGMVFQGVQCKYRSTAYHDGLFDELGIAFPPHLSSAVVKRRSEYLAGRFCAQQILKLLGLNASRLDIRIGTNREPVWPEGVVASISHTMTWAICVATTEPDVLGLGIDVEMEIASDTANNIKQLIINNDEERLIRSFFQAYNQGLTVLFSAKESVFKAVNRLVGSFFDFSAIRAIRVNPNEVVFAVAEPLSDRFHVGAEIPVNFAIIDPEILTFACVTR
jgi:enterobactin synthetase component D